MGSNWIDPFLLHQHPSCDFWIALFFYLVLPISRHLGLLHSSRQQLTSDVCDPHRHRFKMAPLAQAVTVSLQDLQNGMKSLVPKCIYL